MEEFLPGAGFWLFMALLVIWSSVWKALALWKAAKNNSVGWFVVLFIINTAGILEILYIYVFGKKKMESPTPPQQI